MIGQNLTSFWKRGDRFYIVAGYMILSVMLTCMVVSIVHLGRLSLAGFNGTYLVGLGFIVELESILSRRLLKGSSIFDPEWLIFRGTELVVILLAVKLAYYTQYGLNQLLVDTPSWLQNFLYTFMTPEYGFGCLVMALVWVLSNPLAEDLDLLYVDERILRQESESGIYEEREKIREHLVGHLLGIGLFMIVLAALLRSSRVMSWAELPVMRTGIANLLIYFLLFLVLLSLTQFSLMRAAWMRERLSVGGQIARRWLLYSFLLILGLTGVARLLPTGYSIGLLGVLNYLISLAIVIVYELSILLITPFLLLFYWLLSLFKISAVPPPPLQMPAAPPPPTIQPAGSVPFLELLKAILFWAILLGVVGYSLVYYIRERRDLAEATRRLPFYPVLRRFWRWLTGWLSRIPRGLSAAVEARQERLRLARQGAPPPQLQGFLNLRRLSPRQRVVFYYLAMVQRAGEAGLERKPSQTPYDYSRDLSRGLGAAVQTSPEIEQDITALTEKFVEARYSLHPVSAEEVGLVKQWWEKIRRVLGRR
jgi:hypothetical protein